MHLLVFQIKDPERFERVHGEAVVSVVREDVSRAFRAVADSLLRQHERTTEVLCPRFGTWLAAFELGRLEIRLEAEEQEASIARAGRELVRRMLQEQFGMAVAVRTDFRLAALMVEAPDLRPETLLRAAESGLERVPYAGYVPPALSREDFLGILDERRIDVHLQPIVSLDTLKPVGWEALARGPAGSPVREAGALFGAGSYFGLEKELDLACAAAALEWAPRLPPSGWLSVNMSPELAAEPALKELVGGQSDALLAREVLEITEHLPVASTAALSRAVEPFRERGARLALDDAGCGFFNMDMVRALRPDIVKICISVVRRLDSSPAVREAVQEMVWKITECGAAALGEGVEKPEQAEILKACGVKLAQGFLYARPRPAGEVLEALKA